MTIIDPKYKGKYKGASDWIGELINAQCVNTDEKKKGLNLADLFKMADANGIETAEWRKQAEQKNAPGRLRMTIGNQLRTIAKKRAGLYGADGKWHKASDKFMGDNEATEDRDGKPLKANAEKTADAADTAKPAKGKGGKKAAA